jgi:hypothetical protein
MKKYIIMLVGKNGNFQQVNSRGQFDDFAEFAEKGEAEAFLPAINEKWAKINADIRAEVIEK